MLNPVNVLRLAMQVYEDRNITASLHYSFGDQQMCDLIVQLIDNHNYAADHLIKTTDTLDILEDEFEGTEDADLSSDNEGSTSQSTSDEDQSSLSSFQPSPEKKSKSIVAMEDREQAVQYWLNEGGKKRYSLATVQKRFRFVASERQLYEWKSQIEKRKIPPTLAKKTLYERLYVQFFEARKNKYSINDSDLRDWALHIADEMGINDFQASANWILQFKKVHRIGSRKITKFVSRNYARDEAMIEQAASDFVETTKTKLVHYAMSAVYNADQSGFEREMRAKRTLSFVGEKHTETTAQSVSALTHSYTIMPVIGMDGTLFPRLYICLQEAKGTFGPRVLQSMFTARNLIIDASQSGKMGKPHLRLFFSDAFFPYANQESVLLVDSWSTYNDNTILESVKPADKTLEILKIPPGTTGKIQPLDKEFFRQWKALYRRLSDKIIGDRTINFELFQRDSILKFQSFLHYQFSSPRFRNLIRYSWYATKYVDVRPQAFNTPAQFCLYRTSKVCELQECQIKPLIRCSWCKLNICFKHAIDVSHFCDNYLA